MNQETRNRWIEAGKILAINTAGSVLCPVCGKNKLLIKDKKSLRTPFIIERKIYCPSCKAENYLRLVRE